MGGLSVLDLLKHCNPDPVSRIDLSVVATDHFVAAVTLKTWIDITLFFSQMRLGLK